MQGTLLPNALLRCKLTELDDAIANAMSGAQIYHKDLSIGGFEVRAAAAAPGSRNPTTYPRDD